MLREGDDFVGPDLMQFQRVDLEIGSVQFVLGL